MATHMYCGNQCEESPLRDMIRGSMYHPEISHCPQCNEGRPICVNALVGQPFKDVCDNNGNITREYTKYKFCSECGFNWLSLQC